MTHSVLRVDASASLDGSASRAMTDTLIAALEPAALVTRDVVRDPLPYIDQAWIEARLVDAAERSAADAQSLALSDALVGELRAADTIVISAPMYNFAVPAASKAWIDLIARPKETFAYTPDGPKGLLEGKRAYIVVTSGGTPIGSDWDYVSGYLRHLLGFVGITDVTLVTKDTLDDVIGTAQARAA